LDTEGRVPDRGVRGQLVSATLISVGVS
jgi:hypothetical protein